MPALESGASGDQPVNFNRRSADLIGRTIKEFRGRGRGELPIPNRRRHVDGGGSSSSAFSKFAIVTQEAGASTHGLSGITGGTTGKCILLDENKQVTVIVDSGDPEYDSGAVTAAEIEFKSNHRVKCAVNRIVELDSNGTITPGSTFDDNPVWGSLVEVTDYLAELTGFAADKALYTDGTASTDIQWGGGDC